MVDMVPELKPILSDHGRNVMYDDMLPNISTESRFHAVKCYTYLYIYIYIFAKHVIFVELMVDYN